MLVIEIENCIVIVIEYIFDMDILYRYLNIFVIVLSFENLKILFEFIFKGFDVMEYKVFVDFDLWCWNLGVLMVFIFGRNFFVLIYNVMINFYNCKILVDKEVCIICLYGYDLGIW